jgi:tetratricopeptide (TPR) repeat protein
VYKDLAQYQDATRALEQALRLNGNDFEIRYELGVVLAHLRRFAEAEQQLEVAERLNPTGAEVHYQLSAVMRGLNNQNGATEELKTFQALKVRDQEKMQAIQYHTRGDELLAAGKFQQAAEQYRRAMQLDPDSPRLHYNLSLALQGLKDYEGQRKELETAIQLDSNLAPAYYYLARLYIVHGSLAQAEHALKTALAIDPQFAQARKALASLTGESKP